MSQNESTALFERAKLALAGGVSHQARYSAPNPKYINRASGSHKWEVDGTRFVDYAMGSASLLLGHSHPDVAAAIAAQATEGSFYADCHPLEVEWAEMVCGAVPGAERLRFVASGTEATMLAIRIGRAWSGQSKVMRFEGHYHGWHDYALMGSQAPYDEVPSLGVLPGAVSATVTVPPDAQRVDEVLAADPEIGTIICEASGANYGCVPLPEGFLQALREIATRRNRVLIFDEVITGFRWSAGGRQARDGVIPDLTTMAKILTGGLPGGGVGGKAEIMALLDPALEHGGLSPGVCHKGTFNGSPLIAAGAVAAMRHITTGAPQRHADQIAAKLREGMRQAMSERQIKGTVHGDSSTFHIFFGECEDGTVDGIAAPVLRGAPKPLVDGLRTGLRERGVDLMSYMSGVTSAAHTQDDVTHTVNAFAETLETLVAQGLVRS
ncbi:MAG: aminotransferase class III-fold pyridoxal phosphate-dependent enzyme [Chromatiales bacterium]|nr:aminotransferase class III-fold pyridoxal phosphate-dependent enzyme [Chromatiales bacterium]